MPKKSKKTKRRPIIAYINMGLTLIVTCLGLYLMFYPFWPNVSSIFNQLFDKTNGYQYQSYLAEQDQVDPSQLNPVPAENTLVIPKIGVDTKIIEGGDPAALNDGAWHRPNTSSPKKGGNTVLAGHRFLYTEGSNTFYNLDKLKVGDKMLVYWNKKEYDYEITETKIVPPTDLSVEDKSAESIITLYTCTPLWTAENRLVVVGKLINQKQAKEQKP